jgi:hypothetical protein
MFVADSVVVESIVAELIIAGGRTGLEKVSLDPAVTIAKP